MLGETEATRPQRTSFRNLPDVQLLAASELNAYDVLCSDWIVFTQQEHAAPASQRERSE